MSRTNPVLWQEVSYATNPDNKNNTQTTFDKGLTALEGCVGPKKTFLREKTSKIASFGTVFNLFPLFAQMSLFFSLYFLTFQTTALSASTFQHNMYCPLLLLAKWSPLDWSPIITLTHMFMKTIDGLYLSNPWTKTGAMNMQRKLITCS